MATGTIFAASTGFAPPDPSTDLPGDIIVSQSDRIVIENKDPSTRESRTGLLPSGLPIHPIRLFLTYRPAVPADGTIVTVQHYSNNDPATQVLLAEITGLSTSVFEAILALGMEDIEGYYELLTSGDDTWTTADGDGSEIAGGDGNDTITGSDFNDVLEGGFGDNTLKGGAGDDELIGADSYQTGLGDFNRVDYRDALDGVTVTLSGGLNSTSSTATSTNPGDAAGIGTDTLVNVEMIFGSDYADVVTVDGSFSGRDGSFVEFEGGGGDDFFTATGSGRVSFRHALDGVEVDLDAGTATSINPGDTAGIGNDTFSGVFSVRGSDFDDELFGRDGGGGDQFRPRAGNDHIDGRGGLSDELRYTTTSQDVIIDMGPDNQTVQATTTSDGFGGTDTFIGIERLRSGRGDDQLFGDVNDNRLRGGEGDDLLDGRGGDDDLRGEDGNDTLIGGAGNDILRGGYGDNLLEGGADDDFLIGASDFQNSSVDYNRVDYRNALDDVTIQLSGGIDSTLSTAFSTNGGDAAGIGTDTLVNVEMIFGSDFNDTVVMDGTFNTRSGTFLEFEGGAGDDSFTATGNGRVGFRYALDGVTVDLDAGTAVSTNPGDTANIGSDTFSGVTRVRGSDFDDTLLGGNSSFVFEQFRPGAGNDYIDGRGGFSDELRYTSTSQNVIIDLGPDNQTTQQVTGADGFGGTDTFVGIEFLRSGAGDDQLFGDVNNNVLRSGSGNDILRGRDGRDELRGEFGDDDLDGGLGDDILDGGSGNDDLDGGLGDDVLIGGSGDDVLESGGGFDVFYGGSGDDTMIANVIDPDYDGVRASYADAAGPILVNFSTEAKVYGDRSVGTDTLIGVTQVRGTNADDTFYADGNFSLPEFGALNEFEGMGGNDFIQGNGATRISYRSAWDDVTVDLELGLAFSTNGGDAAGIGLDFFSGVNQVRGSSNNDTLLGSSADGENFRGRAGDDFIDGRGGVDDRADYRNSPDRIIVDMSLGANQVIEDGYGNSDTLANIENIRGSAFDDDIFGDANANKLIGRDGKDVLWGREGDDTLQGDGGSDTFVLSVGTGTDIVLTSRTGSTRSSSLDMTFGDVSILASGGADTEIRAAGGGSLILENVLPGDIGLADFCRPGRPQRLQWRWHQRHPVVQSDDECRRAVPDE